MLDKIEDALEVKGIKYDRLDGTMKREERTRAMDALKHDPACEVLLVSLKAGGVGLNLTAAQRVYLMDPYWYEFPAIHHEQNSDTAACRNPAVENQAVDRIVSHTSYVLPPTPTTDADLSLAPPRSDETRHDRKAHNPKYDRGQAFRSPEEEDRVGQHDPRYDK